MKLKKEDAPMIKYHVLYRYIESNTVEEHLVALHLNFANDPEWYQKQVALEYFLQGTTYNLLEIDVMEVVREENQ